MKISDLIELLDGCDPDGEVQLSLPLSMIDGGAYEPGVECALKFEAKELWSTQAHDAGRRADIVTLELRRSDKGFLVRDWQLVASTVINHALSERAQDDIEAICADSPKACALRQTEREPGQFVTQLISVDEIRDQALLEQLRSDFMRIVHADGSALPGSAS